MSLPENIETLKYRAQVAVQYGLKRINVWTPDGWKPPKGFPRRELMCCPTMGGKTWDVDAARLLKWIEAQA